MAFSLNDNISGIENKNKAFWMKKFYRLAKEHKVSIIVVTRKQYTSLFTLCN